MKDGGPAFPFACQGPTTGPEIYYGMSIRDYFAARVMAAMIPRYDVDDGIVSEHPHTGQEMLVRAAYRVADAMIAEREKEA